MTMIKTRALSLTLALSGLFASSFVAAQTTGPQQLVFTGLRTAANPNSGNAQFNAVETAPNGNLYLLLDQKDGVRLLETDPTATTILAQAHIGAKGDIGLAIALDPAGNIYITGTTTSGALASTSGAAFASPADTSTNSFIGKFDQNLNQLFLTFAGSGRMASTGIAATADAVFITGSLFSTTLPVTPNAIIKTPASGSFQNGFVERFNATGTTLLYATYLSGLNGDTAPAAIAADATDNTYITGYTSSSGYPTIAAVVPEILGSSSGFLTKLTPAGNGITFSTFIPGTGLTSIALDPVAQNLLLSGNVSLGQFPVANVQSPIVNTAYQTLLRISLDGTTVLSSTLLAPGTQSAVTPAPNGAVWISSTVTGETSGPPTALLLPLNSLSETGNSYALRVTQQNQIDQTIRFGGVPATNPNYASLPINLTSLTTDATGNPIFAGSAAPTADSSLVAIEAYDLPLYNSPTTALPSSLQDAKLTTTTCTESQCAGSAAYLAKLNPQAAPSLALSVDAAPNITLRNLGTLTATSLQIDAIPFTTATTCPTTLAPGAECTIALTGSGPGSITVSAANATTQTATIPATTNPLNPIAVSTKELDFGIQTASSPAITRTLTLTNLTNQPQTFASTGSSPFTEVTSDCTLASTTTKTLAPGATCHITLGLTAAAATLDGFVSTNWIIGTGNVLLTAYIQSADLNLSASEIDFGTQFPGNPILPRYLYLSNNSATPITHSPIAISGPSFTVTDLCPTVLEPHTVCQLALAYHSPIAPSADSLTLTLDEGLTVLVTGTTLPQPTASGQTPNPNLTVTPNTITFPSDVPVTGTSTTTQTVTIGNTGAAPFTLSLALTGDFTDTTDCTATLPAASTCSVILTFAPSQPGTRQGLLSVTAGAGTTPAYANLSGTATAILTTPNGTFDFGDVTIGQPSVQWYKIAQPFTTLTASSTTADFIAILIEDLGYGHGDPPSSAFTPTVTSSCINCWLGVQFKPAAAGPQTATLNLASSGFGNPEPLALTGTGLPLTGLILTPVSEAFDPIPVNSTSPATLFTLVNLTGATVTLTPPTTTGDFAITTASTGGPACTGPLAPNASCFVQVAFTPTATGSRTGTLTIQNTVSTITAPLTGFGSSDPGLALSPTALIFQNVPGPTATQQTITLTNTGIATLTIGTPTNANAAFTPTSTCTTLAPAATCTITVTFTPTTSFQTDTLIIPGTTTYTVPLSSTYTSEDSGLQILPNQANFGPNPTSTLGLTQQFTINNLTAKSLALSIAFPRQFILSGPSCAGLAPNASCAFSVTFLPLTNGDITGTLFATASPTDGSASFNGLGYVEGYGNGAGSLTITGNLIPNGSDGALNFNQVASGQTAAQTLTLTNTTASPITVRRITSEWPFLVTATTCGATLPQNQNCTVTLTYSPLNQQVTGSPSTPATNDSGTLIIESDSIDSPQLIDLAGTAAPIYVNTPGSTAPLPAYTASPSSLTFDATQVGNASTTQTVTLANTGSTTIHITALQTTLDFTIQNNCTAILPGQSCTLAIAFTPQLTGTRIGALEITTDASTALDFISLLGNASPATLTFSPLSLNFGSVQVGSTSTLPIQIANVSANPATFNTVTASGDYTVASTCPAQGDDLAPSATCTLQVTFGPTQSGIRTGAVSISSSASTLPLSAQLTGIGTQSQLQITPTALSFGSTVVGASTDLTLTLANTGTAPVTNIALAITGDYAITTPCNTTTLAPGTSCAVTITFTPAVLGQRTGTLTITSSDPSSPTTIPLTGTGSPNGQFSLTVDGGPSASATVISGQPATYNLTVTPLNGFSGNVVLNCTPITSGQYATCSLLPSSLSITGVQGNSVATINTITTLNAQTTAHNSTTHHKPEGILLCLLPAALLFWNTRKRRPLLSRLSLVFIAAILTTATLSLSGCGGTQVADQGIRYTPPGTYKYQISASSTNGVQLTQTVTLNLVVTPNNTSGN
jgi:hypothetical protein